MVRLYCLICCWIQGSTIVDYSMCVDADDDTLVAIDDEDVAIAND